MNRRTRIAALAVCTMAVVPVLAGCGAGTSQTAASGGTHTSAPAPATRTVSTIDGASLRLPAGKPAAVFFFTVGCGSCQAGGTALAQARAQAGGRADFLMVDLDPTEGRPAIDAFRTSIGDPTLPTVSTGALDLAQAWQVSALSTVIVLDPAGTVTWRATDPASSDILAHIDKAAPR